jgi:hypothetical protein
MNRLVAGVAALMWLSIGAGVSQAWEIAGHVYCAGSGLPLVGVTIQVVSTDGSGFTGTSTSDATGTYTIVLPETPHCYEATALLGAGESVTAPASGSFDFCVDGTTSEFTQDWVIDGPACSPSMLGCWLTGGGQVVSGEETFSYGGNVNPGCSPTAGEGGQWNTEGKTSGLHFQGFAITVLRCGNVDGIPPGSSSPVTPFNFIEFTGTGRVQGTQGTKVDMPLVYFWGRAEDRHEPGSQGQRDETFKDRLYLNVYTDAGDPTGSSVMLIDGDADPATVDPTPVLHGNLQIHVSSCTSLPGVPDAPARKNAKAGSGGSAAASEVATLSFAAPGPNPAADHVMLRYALPRDGKVSLAIYDVAGRLVRSIATGSYTPGQYAVSWNLRDQADQPVPNGVFFARLAAGDRVITRAVTVAR